MPNTTHFKLKGNTSGRPKDIPFQIGDIVVVRTLGMLEHPKKKSSLFNLKKQVLSFILDNIKQIRNFCLHWVIEIYVRKTREIYTLGLGENLVDHTIWIQSPDVFVHLSEKPKYEHLFYGAVRLKKNEPVNERLQRIQKAKCLHTLTTLNKQQIDLLRKINSTMVHKKKIFRIWKIPDSLTKKYKYKFSSMTFRRQRRTSSVYETEKEKKRIRAQREAYQCQKFVDEFLHHPHRLARMFGPPKLIV